MSATKLTTLAAALILAFAGGASAEGPVIKAQAGKAAQPTKPTGDAAREAARPDDVQRTSPQILSPAAGGASAMEPPPPQAAPAMKVVKLDVGELVDKRPVLRLGAADAPADAVVGLPLNKTRPLDLPARVQDIVVGNPEIADVFVRAPNQVFLMGKAVGDTNVFFLDGEGRLLRRLEVNVHFDTEALQAAINEFLPGENVVARAFGGTIYLTGTVASEAVAADARAIARRFVADDAQIINMMTIRGAQQVLLKVKVAEWQKEALKQLDVPIAFGPKEIGNWALSGFSVGRIFNAGDPPHGSFTVTGPGGLVAGIDALEANNLVTTLAEPNLTALSGEEATMLAGGEFPIGAWEDDNGRVTVEYRPFGVQLAFVPVILGPNRISLKVATEVSEITDAVGPFGFPVLAARRASSTVELPSGGSMMIAGLLQSDINQRLSGVPGLSDIPVLGTLFRSNSFRNAQSELVVTVTAYIVEPQVERNLALPTDGFAPASDLDRYLLGKLQRVYGRGDRPLATEGLNGPVGYIVE